MGLPKLLSSSLRRRFAPVSRNRMKILSLLALHATDWAELLAGRFTEPQSSQGFIELCGRRWDRKWW